MKKLLVALFLITLSCEKSYNEKQKEFLRHHQELDTLIMIDKYNTPVNDSIFLGFRFGMSKSEYNNHETNLIELDSIESLENDFFYLYNLGKYKSFKTIGKPIFINDSLRQLELSVLGNDNYKEGVLVADFVSEPIKAENNFSDKIIMHFSKKEYSEYWINNNLLIEVSSKNQVAIIKYTDTRYINK